MNNKKSMIIVGMLILLVALAACNELPVKPDDILPTTSSKLEKFNSCDKLIDAFEEAQKSGQGNMWRTFGGDMMVAEAMVKTSAVPTADSGAQRDYSETNIQVEGVDEADIIKTDGDYIYAVSGNKLYVARAYPAEDAELISVTEFKDFNPNELFIQGDRLLMFGSSSHDNIKPYPEPMSAAGAKMIAPDIWPGPRHVGVVSAKLFTIADKKDPDVLRTVEIEGSYVSSRKIGSDVYFVVNSYPNFGPEPRGCITPLYSEDSKEFAPIVACEDVSYIPPLHASNFITVAAMSMTDENADVEKEVIAGNGQNIYSSQDNLYIAQSTWGKDQKTSISKFALNNGKIRFITSDQVPGKILNQFSMDEHKNNFRIATTIEGYANNKDTSTNNIYVLDSDLETIGKIEKIAPGESIYAVRFMGDRAYLITFRHVDPLFVVDLSNPREPEILGKLKIPGYSEYLHPYDENHVIGIGKEVDASIDADKIHTENAVYFTAIQGVKLAVFDVSDVAHPIELYKEVIGDRGTESIAATNHKAFLFDKEKNMLAIPIIVAELPEGAEKNQMGDFVFQGAYVYDLTLEDGFNLRGKVTHYDDDSVFKKAGHYFSRDSGSIKRILYIEDILYTFSNKRLQLNNLDSLKRLKALDLPYEENQYGRPYYEDEVVMMR
ncbi:beta-propeller domain-containing protein [Candidatus Woesearchaeota archaeon]|nr:beta-propeller domain-containing protein [Candidatus Woesearchaeota archaeon]